MPLSKDGTVKVLRLLYVRATMLASADVTNNKKPLILSVALLNGFSIKALISIFRNNVV